MPAPPDVGAPDFRLYHSNALEVLAGILAGILQSPAPGQPLLAPDVVLIPQVAMRRWLQATLATRHGVAANLEFLTPGEFVGRALQANPAPGGAVEPGLDRDELDAAVLQWHLYAALTDPALLSRPALGAIAGHLEADDPLRAWSLAGELATVFEKYQAWRRDWLLRWEDGADPEDPQAILWREVARGRQHRARRIQQYLARHEAPGAPLPEGLPARLCAFATLNVSPDVLRVIATQARVGTLHFFVPSPARDYWGDLQRVRALPLRHGVPQDDADEHPENGLLQAWGAAGADFMRVIGDYELVHASADLQAHVDPGEGGGALHGSLLRRLQSDLFHRRATPGFPLRDQVDRGDPSLQLHACHTRLRELQVLHDQLRGLFDDPRFDPPLEPREVAVLAPDIDEYLPYLDAVFGDRGQPGAIPYALADASPLADEPLVEVFLKLLALPVSRFGLSEVLDLLASPPLAEASGLDPAALERLHGWLSAAGARWGLDAAHRARLQAPEDDAFTWAFALDRLLLGHASGSDGEIAGVAPLPDLEGSALDALDVLVGLLRVLARHARLLGGELPPAAWRDRLLGMLDALLPRPPSNPSTRRALDRLRTLVDDFAATAARAGYEDTVPAEAVRAHFGRVLREADTRAPLLTGGVSVGRMVPMRLLPFRVICVLGMNDGDFPRREPAAGLNRLTAELGSERRRPGDRSTREDDRFLFLQLFAAAQDVFYVSWQGADPRDGSAREPSVLVSELIAVAAAQHAPQSAAAGQLVVQHPLQPFSPEAFGAGDDDGGGMAAVEPRRFSYRAHWREAAVAGLAPGREALAPWITAPLEPRGDTEEQADEGGLPIAALRRFLLQPAEALLQQRLGLRLDPIEGRGEDVEPLVAPGRGLERSLLQRAVFDALLQGGDEERICAGLRARAMLAAGASGRRMFAEVREQVAEYVEAFERWRDGAEPRSLQVEATVDGLRVHGQLTDVYPHGIARVRFDEQSGPGAIRAGLDWLLASAAGTGLDLVQFHLVKGAGVGPHVRPALDPCKARDALRRLLQLRGQGLREPLPFAPYSSWDYYQAATGERGSLEKGAAAAAKRWRGAGRGFAEGEGAAFQLALRGRDPFAGDEELVRFADVAMAVFSALEAGEVYSGVDAGALRGLAAVLEDGEAGE